MLRGLREARWARLPPEATATAIWSEFRDAVMAASEENQRSMYPGPEEGREEEADEEPLPGAEDRPQA